MQWYRKIQMLANKRVYLLLLCSLCFSAYAFLYLGTYPVTPFTVASGLFLIFQFKYIGMIKKGIEKNICSIAMIVWVFIGMLFSADPTITAMLLALFHFSIYFCSFRVTTERQFRKELHLVQKILTVLAIYGIYQIFGRKLGLPFTDLKIEGHMVKGFNWANPISIGGSIFLRSNAIFLEPSFFSQWLALNILLYLQRLLDGENVVLWIAINLIAFICTFAGTGIIVLLIGFLYVLVKNLDTMYKFKRMLFYAGLVLALLVAVSLVVDLEPVISHFTERFTELTSADNNISGNLRFGGAFQILGLSLKENWISGCGIGNIRDFTKSLSGVIVEENGYIANTIARIGIETGLIGLCLWFGTIFTDFRKAGNSYQKILLLFCLIMQCTHDAFGSAYFWAIFCYANVRFVDSTDQPVLKP